MILGAGLLLGQLTICVLGVMVITSEYSTGMIRASLLAVPRRLPMLAAKAVVVRACCPRARRGRLVPARSSSARRSCTATHRSPLGDPGVLRAVFGGGLYLACCGLFALALGAIIRHTAAAITGVIGFILVLSPLAQLLPGSIGKHVHAYLPSEAGHLIAQAHQAQDDLLTPWQGFGVFAVWTAVLLVVAAYAQAPRRLTAGQGGETLRDAGPSTWMGPRRAFSACHRRSTAENATKWENGDAGRIRGQSSRRRNHRCSDGGPEHRHGRPDGGPERRYKSYTEPPLG